MKLHLAKRRITRYALYFGITFILCLLFLMGQRLWTFHRSAAELQAIIDRLDAEDPDWDWDSFLKNRKPIPDEKNSATLINRIAGLPNLKTYAFDPKIEEWQVLPGPMSPEIADWAGEFLGARKAAMELAQNLAGLPMGRHSIEYRENLYETTLPCVDNLTFR
jgi:hypothetical protein